MRCGVLVLSTESAARVNLRRQNLYECELTIAMENGECTVRLNHLFSHCFRSWLSTIFLHSLPLRGTTGWHRKGRGFRRQNATMGYGCSFFLAMYR